MAAAAAMSSLYFRAPTSPLPRQQHRTVLPPARCLLARRQPRAPVPSFSFLRSPLPRRRRLLLDLTAVHSSAQEEGGEGGEAPEMPKEPAEPGASAAVGENAEAAEATARRILSERRGGGGGGGGDSLWGGVAEEVREIEWPALGKVLGTTGVVLAVIAGSSVALLSVNAVLAELSDRVFAGRGAQDFFG